MEAFAGCSLTHKEMEFLVFVYAINYSCVGNFDKYITEIDLIITHIINVDIV